MSQLLGDKLTGTRQTTQASLVASESMSTAMLRQEEQLSRQVAALVPEMSLVLGDRLAGLEKTIQAQLAKIETKVLAASRKNDTPSAMATGALQRPADRTITALGNRGERSTLVDLPCSCPVHPSGARHRDACPWAFLRRTEHSLRGKLKIFNYLIRFEVAVGYSRRCFFRDLHVYPNFTMCAICPDDAPAFRLLLNVHHNKKAADLRVELGTVLIQLRNLFMEGRAWPTDVDENGRSLFQVLAICSPLKLPVFLSDYHTACV